MPRTHLPVRPVGGVLVLLLLCATHQAKNLVSHGHDLHDEPLARRSRRTDSDDSNVLGFLALRPGHVELDLLTLVQDL